MSVNSKRKWNNKNANELNEMKNKKMCVRTKTQK